MRVTQRLTMSVLACVLLPGIGCVQQRHTTGEVIKPVEQVGAVAPARAKVYLFLVNGADLAECYEMTCLRDQVINSGFPKVYYAQRFDKEWYRREIHRLHRDDNNNRFFILGFGTGAEPALDLAKCLTCESIPIDGALFVDPVGLRQNSLTDTRFYTQIIRSQHWKLSPRAQPTENTLMAGLRHDNVIKSCAVAETVVGLLTNAARQVTIIYPPHDCLPLRDGPKLIPRPDEPKQLLSTPGWEFLCPKFPVGPACPLPPPRSSIPE